MSKPISAADHLRKAEQALRTCRGNLRDGDTEGACNRAYYAMFNTAHVALQAAGVIPTGTVTKSHGGLINAFSKAVVLPGTLDRRFGRALSKVYQMRLIADYSGETPDGDDAAWAAAQAEAFVAAVRAAFAHR